MRCIERETSGKGQEVATSLLQAQIFMLDFQASRWLNAREVPPQAGNNHPTSIPTGVFKTRDGYINIAAAGAAIWERLCRAIGAEELMGNPDYATAAARSKNRDALNAAIDTHLAERTSAEWVERLNNGRRSLRADLLNGQGVRRSAGRAPGRRAGHRHG